MATYVNNENVSRDALAADVNEALHMPLASAVQALPRGSDAERIFTIAKPVPERLHVRYRIILAFYALHDRGLLNVKQRRAAVDAIEHFRDRADDSLLKAIDVAKTNLG